MVRSRQVVLEVGDTALNVAKWQKLTPEEVTVYGRQNGSGKDLRLRGAQAMMFESAMPRKNDVVVRRGGGELLTGFLTSLEQACAAVAVHGTVLHLADGV